MVTPQPEPEPMTVTQALARLSADLGPIAKADRMQGAAGNYSYRGIDALLRKASPLMAAHGVTFLPTVLDRYVEQVPVGKDKVWRLVTLTVAYTITGPAGDSVIVTTCGEGLDGGDKAANKAMTGAFKQALVQSLTIADGHDDPDHLPTPEQAGTTGNGAGRASGARSRPAPAESHATAVTPAGDRSEQETAIRAVLATLDPGDAQVVRDEFVEKFGSGLAGVPVEQHAAAGRWVEERLALGFDTAPAATPSKPLETS